MPRLQLRLLREDRDLGRLTLSLVPESSYCLRRLETPVFERLWLLDFDLEISVRFMRLFTTLGLDNERFRAS